MANKILIWFLIQETQNENCFETFGSLCAMILVAWVTKAYIQKGI